MFILTTQDLIEREAIADARPLEVLDVKMEPQVPKAGRGGGHRTREAAADGGIIEVLEVKREPQIPKAGRGGHRVREAEPDAEALEVFDARDPQLPKAGRGGGRKRSPQLPKAGRGGGRA